MWGSSVLKSYSKTQGTIAQSSTESELIAVVKSACEAIGTVPLADDLARCHWQSASRSEYDYMSTPQRRSAYSSGKELDVFDILTSASCGCRNSSSAALSRSPKCL